MSSRKTGAMDVRQRETTAAERQPFDLVDDKREGEGDYWPAPPAKAWRRWYSAIVLCAMR